MFVWYVLSFLIVVKLRYVKFWLVVSWARVANWQRTRWWPNEKERARQKPSTRRTKKVCVCLCIGSRMILEWWSRTAAATNNDFGIAWETNWAFFKFSNLVGLDDSDKRYNKTRTMHNTPSFFLLSLSLSLLSLLLLMLLPFVGKRESFENVHNTQSAQRATKAHKKGNDKHKNCSYQLTTLMLLLGIVSSWCAREIANVPSTSTLLRAHRKR